MGKNYVENSLKRFLKRKVKITLGFVVAFMITGVAAFAGEKTDSKTIVGEHNKNYKEALENLKELGQDLTNLKKEVTIGNTKYTVTGDKDYLILTDDSNKEIKIETKYISEKLKTDILDKLGTISSTKLENNSILLSEQVGTKDIKEKITNNGIIYVGRKTGQIANNENIVVNNGIIISEISTQGAEGKNTQLINNGILYNKDYYGQVLSKDGTINATAINNGIIYSSYTGQISRIGSNNTIINNGIILNTTFNGQDIAGTTNKSYNYGLIDVKQGTGILATEKAEAFNYGVIKVKEAKNAFNDASNKGNGVITNKGIVIADSGTLDSKYNTGILLDSNNYNVVGDDVKIFGTDETNKVLESFGDKNTFGDFTKGFVKDTTVQIDNTEGKVIGAVVTEKAQMNGNAVFNYDGNDLFLKDTSLVGYFEQDGTLLDVGTGNLTLGGDTNITAVKNDMSLDVYAVKLGDNGKITIMDDAKINGIIKGNDNSEITFTQAKGTFDVDGGKVSLDINNAGQASSDYQKYFHVTLTSTGKDDNGDTVGNSVDEIKISTENAAKDLTNKLIIEDSVTVGANADGNSIYDTNKTNTDAMLEIEIKDIDKIEGNISLGVGQDIVKVYNKDIFKEENTAKADEKIEINLGEGQDKFVVVGDKTKVNNKDVINIFNYNVVNAETVELDGGTWGAWDKANGTIGFDSNSSKAENKPNLKLGNSTTMNITLNAENKGSDFANYVDKMLGENQHAYITGTGNGSAVKYLINETTGLDASKLSSDKYSFDENIEYKSAIFNVVSEKDKGTTVTVKTAEEMGLSGEDRIIYEAYLNQIKAGNANADVIGQINSYNSSEEFANLIKQTSVTGEAYYTAGSVLTKDITNSYLASVEDFTKRAGKGEWLAQGKYINSDTEFDGGKSVKGYDGDITGTVGMIEYGVTENTSYGAVFGMGDAKMDIQGGGKLDGDNTYFGAYMKHRTQNGIELVANIGYMESEMDSVLRNDFDFSNSGVTSNGKTFEEGTADSSAVVISLKGRKDYRLSDSVKLQPTLGARVTFINQEEAENPEMHFTIAEQDIIVVEGTAGMGIAKEFALSEGKFELSTGAEYTFAAANSNNDARYKVFDEEHPLDDTDAAENRGTVYIGADYEHENGVGFNGKYEMMWSDKGDDSRITAGVSYRF